MRYAYPISKSPQIKYLLAGDNCANIINFFMFIIIMSAFLTI